MPVAPSRLDNVVYVGIDPGQKGGLVALYPQFSQSFRYSVIPMPTTETYVWNWFADLTPYSGKDYRLVACIEKVHSMPKQGVVSAFTFGAGYGALRMAVVAAGMTLLDNPDPRKWQKALDISPRKKTEGTTAWKTRLLARAQQLYPNLGLWSEPKSKGRQLAVADALLIAEYCKRKYEGKIK